MKPFAFGKDKSEITKGVAILMMMWLHTFGTEQSIGCYTSFWNIGGGNFENLLAKACNPVGLFMVLSGYGLYLSFLKSQGKVTLMQNLHQTTHRTIRMYIPWWITLAIGVPISFLAGIIETSFSLEELICHLFAWNVSWNNVGWYILPFAIISYLMHFIFPSFKKHSLLWLVFSIVTYIGINKVYSMYWGYISVHQEIKIICRLFEFLFPMLLGSWVAKNREFEIRSLLLEKYISAICALCIPMMFVLSMYLRGIPMYPIYCAVLVLFIVNTNYTNIISKVLATLGKHSLNIWFIHLYLIPFAYKLHFSPIVFLMIVLGSLYLSTIVNLLSNQVKVRLQV